MSHEFLRVLGVPPLLGRGFLPDEDRPGGRNDVVIIAESLWRTRFGGDPSIVGRAIVLDEVPRTVVGVLPAGAWIFKDDVFFVPAVLTPGTPRAARAPHWAVVFGRLAPGVTPAQADAELKSIKRRLNAEYPPFKQQWGVVVRPVTDVLGGVTRTPLLILLGAVSLVLLIACANVANLVLARSCQRQQELAVRAAIGASGWRLVRQVLTENLILALLGGAAGVAVAYVGVGVLNDLAARAMPITFTPSLDLRVLVFSLAVTMATGPLFGLLPALRARRPDLNATLTNGGRGATAGGHQRTQATLVAAEVALTVVLLTSAGLLLRSLANAASVDPGFQPSRVLAFDVSLPDASYTSRDKRIAFANELVSRLRALPGVEGAGTGMAIPFSDGGYGEFFRRPGNTESEAVIGRLDYVSPGYLEALGTRLLAGRRIDRRRQQRGGPARGGHQRDRVERCSSATCRRSGSRSSIAADTWTVVGVVADVVDRRLDAASKAFAYAPMARNTSQLSVVVRTPLEPLTPGRAGARGDRATRSGRRPREAADARSGDGRLDAAAQGRARAHRRLRGHRAGAGQHRPLRRHGLRRRDATPRVRHPHRLWRRPPRPHSPGAGRRPPDDGRGPGGRSRRGGRRRAAARERAVSGERERPARPGGHERDGDRRGDAGLSRPGVARRESRAGRRAAGGVIVECVGIRRDAGVRETTRQDDDVLIGFAG